MAPVGVLAVVPAALLAGAELLIAVAFVVLAVLAVCEASIAADCLASLSSPL